MKSLKIAKMNIKSVIRPAVVYYAIFSAVAMLLMFVSYWSNGGSSMSGVEASTIIFLFVLGLNSFKNNYYFAKSNNIARKTFIKGLLISALPIVAIMSIIDIIINRITNIFITNPTFYDMSYQGSFTQVNQLFEQNWVQSNAFGDILKTLLFQFSFCLLAYLAGIIINMIYYRCNKIMKLIVSVSPIILIMFVNSPMFFNSSLAAKISEIIPYIFGFNPVNVYACITTFLVATLALSAISFLLIRKAEIKER